ncbi:hypothetical protein IFT84_11570 [Rhizobium sp. CFBP 8762]|uniref:hypothetical protein n=1 Tax=Rhizobium sp. CFBP 8762 TaxID=2775279 RepID=UPI0017877BF9|nr:hypothetical protein [Rhizobium sp. CFBP 8762]MBD8555157.1 hypothetical protein [Rhizobium sp. CFBP 8762]
MTDQNIKRITLAQILKMKENGELYHDPNAPADESLSAYFWANVSVESFKTAKLKPSKT